MFRVTPGTAAIVGDGQGWRQGAYLVLRLDTYVNDTTGWGEEGYDRSSGAPPSPIQTATFPELTKWK